MIQKKPRRTTKDPQNIVGNNRLCSKCGQRKPFSEFPLRGSHCKTCRGEYRRAQKLSTIFNLTPQEADQIFEFQGGVCAICKQPPKRGGNRLSIDHDHKSGLIRGGLCWLCNRALGYIKDDLERLEAMVEYLKNPPAIQALGKEVYGQKGRTTKKRRRQSNKRVKK